MKRDMDFVRDILLAIEEVDDGVGCNYTDLRFCLNKKGYSDDDKLYGHCEMMAQGDLIEFSTRRVAGGKWVLERPIKLLWGGHDFLDAVRDQGVWEKVKKTSSTIGSATFEIIKTIAIETAKGHIGY